MSRISGRQACLDIPSPSYLVHERSTARRGHGQQAAIPWVDEIRSRSYTQNPWVSLWISWVDNAYRFDLMEKSCAAQNSSLATCPQPFPPGHPQQMNTRN